MTLKYSASARGFFDSNLHRVIPEDAVTITARRHASLLAGQAEGQEIVPDKNGRPQLKSLNPVTLAQARAARTREIKREAARRINERMPLWRQVNALRENRDPGFHVIDTIRAASNLIEAQLLDLKTIEAISSLPVQEHPLWPVFDGAEPDS